MGCSTCLLFPRASSGIFRYPNAIPMKILQGLLLSLLFVTSAQAAPMETVLFEKGGDGYNNVRIPAICQTPSGALIAFAEGREAGDAGDIDLIYRRSNDNGKTWSKVHVLWNDKDNTCGNPAPVVDQVTGTIWLFLTWNKGSDHETAIMTGSSEFPRKVYLTWSVDDGRTWAEPRDLSGTLRHPEWRWYATGPCNGIQLTRGPHKGRLIIPANHSDKATQKRTPETYRSHIIYSDDHGRTWQLGAIQDPLTNESTVVELTDGSVMHNMRSYHGKGNRAVAISRDGGESFEKLYLDDGLKSPVCQASILRYSWPEEGKGRILFSSPAGNKRTHMTVRVSYDDGKTWPVEKEIHDGGSAYSNLIALPENQVGLVYEKDGYKQIVFSRFPMKWLEE